LAGESARDEVDRFKVIARQLLHVPVLGHVGPVFREYLPAPFVYLYLPLDFPPCPFKAEVEATDTGEQ
jgi:hypothetical protein